MTKIRPLHDRVVVKRLDAENKSAGGIVIPDTAGEKPQGEVVAVGKGKIRGRQGAPARRQSRDRILSEVLRASRGSRRHRVSGDAEDDIMWRRREVNSTIPISGATMPAKDVRFQRARAAQAARGVTFSPSGSRSPSAQGPQRGAGALFRCADGDQDACRSPKNRLRTSENMARRW